MLIAIIICTGVDIGMALPTPKLTVPNKFEPTNTAVRGWVVNPFGMQSSQWWLAILAAVPAILATILIFLDQQITAVIVNRREHKLKVLSLLLSRTITDGCRFRNLMATIWICLS